MKILCVFLRHGTRRYPSAFPFLRRWYETVLPDVSCDYWIIDNALADHDSPTVESERISVVAGDNEFGEFSGWARFLREHQSLVSGYDLVHFVTSAYQQHYSRYLQQITPSALAMAAEGQICLGHVDYYDHPVRIGAAYSDHWIRTCFFFMAPATLRRIGRWVQCREQDSVFDGEGGFRPNGFIDERFQRQLELWLSGQPHQGVAYHSPKSERSEFIRKAMAIVNEHGFSVAMREAGVRLVDLGFSFLACASAFPARLLATTPMNRQLELRYDYLAAFPEEEWNRPDDPNLFRLEEKPMFYRWNTILEFGAGRAHNAHLGPGWSSPEVGGCWTDGPDAFLRFLVEPIAAPLQVSLLMSGFMGPGIPQQTVNVSCGRRRMTTIMVGRDATYSLVVPYEYHLGLRSLILRLELPTATSPRAIGAGTDERSLAISLRAAFLSSLLPLPAVRSSASSPSQGDAIVSPFSTQ
jgi:hypothetical protein